MDIRFHASDSPERLVPGHIDVAIRYGPGPYPETPSLKLWDDELTPVCSPTLNLTSETDLRRAVLIHVAGRRRPEQGVTWEGWCSLSGLSGVDVAAGPHLPDSMSAVQAAIAGQGVAIVSGRLVADAIKAGLLVAPFASTITGDAFHFLSADAIEQSDPVTRLRTWFSEQA